MIRLTEWSLCSVSHPVTCGGVNQFSTVLGGSATFHTDEWPLQDAVELNSLKKIVARIEIYISLGVGRFCLPFLQSDVLSWCYLHSSLYYIDPLYHVASVCMVRNCITDNCLYGCSIERLRELYKQHGRWSNASPTERNWRTFLILLPKAVMKVEKNWMYYVNVCYGSITSLKM